MPLTPHAHRRLMSLLGLAGIGVVLSATSFDRIWYGDQTEEELVSLDSAGSTVAVPLTIRVTTPRPTHATRGGLTVTLDAPPAPVDTADTADTDDALPWMDPIPYELAVTLVDGCGETITEGTEVSSTRVSTPLRAQLGWSFSTAGLEPDCSTAGWTCWFEDGTCELEATAQFELIEGRSIAAYWTADASFVPHSGCGSVPYDEVEVTVEVGEPSSPG